MEDLEYIALQLPRLRFSGSLRIQHKSRKAPHKITNLSHGGMIWHIQFEWGQHTRSFNFWGKQCVQNSYFSLSIYKISCHLHLWWKQFDTVKSALCIKSSWINCTKKSQRIRRRCARLQSGYGQQHQSGTLCFLSSLGKNIQSRGPGQSLSLLLWSLLGSGEYKEIGKSSSSKGDWLLYTSPKA